MKKVFVLAAALIAAVVSQSAGATVIYSNLGPGGSYSPSGGQLVTGSSSTFGASYSSAARFRSQDYVSVDQIDVALSNLSGMNSAKVSLWTSNNGIPGVPLPGIELGSWTVSGFPAYNTSSTALITISGISGVQLAGGQHYFLAVTPVSQSDDSANIWNLNTSGAAGRLAFDYGYGFGWQGYYNYVSLLPAFDVIGTKVPEPGTIALVLGGIAGALRLRRCKAGRGADKR